MGIFPGDTGPCRLVRAGWQAGMLGSGLVLCIDFCVNGQSLMPQVLLQGRNVDFVQRQRRLAFMHF